MIKFVEGTDNKVIITSDGRIFRRYPVSYRYPEKGFTGFREAKLSKARLGYLQVSLSGGRNLKLVHRLVAKAFIPNPLGLRDVDHIDGNKSNNRVENLRWVTHKENVNNPNTKWKGHRSWTNIQGFNPKTNHKTAIFTNLREASAWITPEGKDIKPRSLVSFLNKKTTYRNYLWTAKLVTGEEYRKLLE